jgi:hypothetical protein
MTNEDRTISRDDLERAKQQGTPAVRAVLNVDGRAPHELRRRVVVGREPEGSGDVDTIVLAGDPLVSKTHLAFDVTSDGVVVIDLGSSNGSTITIGGLTSGVATDAWTPVPDASIVTVGDTTIAVDVEAPATAQAPPQPALQPPPTSIVTSVPGAAPPAATSSCPTCGRSIIENSRFCDGCGSPVDGGLPPAAPPALVPPVTGPPTTAPWVSGGVTSQTEAPPIGGTPATTTNKQSKRTFMIAGAAAAVVAVAVVGWLALSGGDEGGPSATALPRVASGVEERWSVGIDGAQDAVGSASSLFILAIDNENAEVVSLAGGTGDERWATDVARNVSYSFLSGVLDGVVLGQSCDFDDECEAFGLDASSGEVLWTEGLDGFAFISGRGSYLWGDSDTLELIDPQTGKSTERVRGDSIDFDGDYAYVRDNDEVEVFDLKNLSSKFGPVDVDDDSSGAIYQGGNLITSLDDELIVIKANGDVDRESRVPADSIYRILPGPNGIVIVDTDEGVFGLDPVDGRAEEIWSTNSSLSYGFVGDVGPMVIVVDGSDDGSDAEILDAGSGETLVDLRGYYETDQLTGSNGLVNIIYERNTEATALRYSDGEELWDERFDGSLRLVDDGLVEFDDGDVRFYR